MTSPEGVADLDERLIGYAAALRRSGAIRTDAVERAFAIVPRHRFLPCFRYRADKYALVPGRQPAPEVLDLIYANNSLVTHTGGDGDPTSSSSAPSVMARMLEALDLREGHKVLEIGTGTGYNAAIITHITGAEVTTVEAGRTTAATAIASIRALGLERRIHVVHGDGYHGHAARGPYDRVIVTCGVAGIPPRWLDQITDDAVIVAPLAHAGVHPIFAVRRSGTGGLVAKAVVWGDFMAAVGHLRPANLFGHDPAVDIPGDRLRLGTDPVLDTPLDAAAYHDLWFSLAVHDRRITRAYMDDRALDPARWACALVDRDDGAVWVHRDGGTTLAGHPRLLPRLTALVRQWQENGRPAVAEWMAELHHADTGSDGLLRPKDWCLIPRTA